MKTNVRWGWRLGASVVLLCLLREVAAADVNRKTPGTTLEKSAESALAPTPEQRAAFNALDAAIAWFDADLARVADAGERARVAAVLDVFKTRRNAMRKARFDQVRYDELRFDLNVEYQRLGRYLAPLRTPASRGDSTRAAAIEIPDLKLVLLPVAAGTFVMGQPQGTASGPPDEAPATRVILSKPFWLGATEVTVAQWAHFVEATGHRSTAETGAGLLVANATDQDGKGAEMRSGLTWRNPGREQRGEHPVVGVSWKDAQAFCSWLNERERTAGRLREGYVYSLPTEAQWEYSCRAGNRGPDPENLDEFAWHSGNSGGVPQSVGTKQPNLWGFFDLQGNVSEWCLDWYGPYAGGMVTDPRGAREGNLRVERGGNARSPAGRGIAATKRSSMPGSQSRDDLGFRVALIPVLGSARDASSQQ